MVPTDQHGRLQLPKGAFETFKREPDEGDLVAYGLDPDTGRIVRTVYLMPQKRGASAGGEGAGADRPAKARPDLTQKGEAMVGDMRTDALHAALRAEPIDDLRLTALLVLAFGGDNIEVKTGETAPEARHGRLAAIARTLMEGGAVTSDPDAVRLAAREVLVHVLSCRANWSRSGAVARVAGAAVGADAHLPTMATPEFLACLSKPAVERVAVDLGVPVQPTGKATRAAVIARVGEGCWVYPQAGFAAGDAAGDAAARAERRRTGEDLGPDEPDDAPGEGETGAGDTGAEDAWMEQAFDEAGAEAA